MAYENPRRRSHEREPPVRRYLDRGGKLAEHLAAVTASRAGVSCLLQFRVGQLEIIFATVPWPGLARKRALNKTLPHWGAAQESPPARS
jgi:hypothetical protein